MPIRRYAAILFRAVPLALRPFPSNPSSLIRKDSHFQFFSSTPKESGNLLLPAMPNKRSNEAKGWSMRPDLHDDVAALLKNDGLNFAFHEADTDYNSIRDYDTNIMGKFKCLNKTCNSSGWSSKMIAITIRMYDGNKYNARVYRQRCMSCKNLSKPLLDGSYAERVSYRLKKWRGIAMELPHYTEKSNGPHQRDLCEGCKNGHCSLGD